MSEPRSNRPKGGDGAKPFLGVLFECCNIYRRIYLHHSGAFYFGQCPKCGRSIRFEVDDRKGKKTRFWKAG